MCGEGDGMVRGCGGGCDEGGVVGDGMVTGCGGGCDEGGVVGGMMRGMW